jgi:hypothetical protein
MTSKLRWIPALGAFFVLTIALAACGGGLPGNSVVKVDSQAIKRSTFDHWLQIAAVSAQGQQNPSATTPPKVTVPDAPTFAKCVANKKKTAAKPAKGQPEPTDAQLKQQCQTQYDGLKKQVLSFLIRSTWLDNEAKSMKINVPDKDVQKQIDAAKKQAFPKPADFQKFLTKQGLTEADVFYQQRSQLLEQKITQKITKGKDKVTDAQIQAYYDKNKQRFATPERRDLRIVLTKDKAKAAQAKRALDSGQPWKTVTKKRQARRRGQGPAGEGPGRRRLRRPQGQDHRPRQDAVRLVRLRGHEDHARQAAVPRPVQGLDQADPLQHQPAEGAAGVRQGLPQAVEGQDRLPQGLRDRRLQERAEAEGPGDRHDGPARRAGHDDDHALRAA